MALLYTCQSALRLWFRKRTMTSNYRRGACITTKLFKSILDVKYDTKIGMWHPFSLRTDVRFQIWIQKYSSTVLPASTNDLNNEPWRPLKFQRCGFFMNACLHLQSLCRLHLCHCTSEEMQMWTQSEWQRTALLSLMNSASSTTALWSPFSRVCMDTGVHIATKSWRFIAVVLHFEFYNWMVVYTLQPSWHVYVRFATHFYITIVWYCNRNIVQRYRYSLNKCKIPFCQSLFQHVEQAL